jgi:lipopolysaccharide transport system ATP-binding protein
MSSSASVRARGLQKQYSLHDSHIGVLAGLMTGREAPNKHWAVRDFDLEAKAGDFIGIVGRNGAGKSTLLQIIAGILTPDSGHLEISGRVAALLELGAGFDPEFNGWENAKLCASLYGLNASQIDQRLQSIDELAGLGDFMDRPLREYSSGMLAKLAFSVCLHVDADVVIVDELLGVGDFRFRQLAAKRLLKFSEKGIVFFVSHSEAAVLSLCNRAIFIEDGRKVRDGSPKSVYRAYQRLISKYSGAEDADSATVDFLESGEDLEGAGGQADAPHSSDTNEPISQTRAIIEAVELKSIAGAGDLVFNGGERLVLTVRTKQVDPRYAYITFLLKDAFGQTVCARDTLDLSLGRSDLEGSVAHGARFEFELPYLPTGDYAFDVVITHEDDTAGWHDRHESVAGFSVASRHISEGLANIAMDEVTITKVDSN